MKRIPVKSSRFGIVVLSWVPPDSFIDQTSAGRAELKRMICALRTLLQVSIEAIDRGVFDHV
jgi:hypothetical protein